MTTPHLNKVGKGLLLAYAETLLNHGQSVAEVERKAAAKRLELLESAAFRAFRIPQTRGVK